MAGYALAGLWVPAVTHYYLLSLPVAVAAIVLGRVVNRRLAGRSFIRYVHLALILIGIILLVQAVGRLGGWPLESTIFRGGPTCQAVDHTPFSPRTREMPNGARCSANSARLRNPTQGKAPAAGMPSASSLRASNTAGAQGTRGPFCGATSASPRSQPVSSVT